MLIKGVLSRRFGCILGLQPIPVAAMLDDRTFYFVIQHGRHAIVILDLQGLVANKETAQTFDKEPFLLLERQEENVKRFLRRRTSYNQLVNCFKLQSISTLAMPNSQT